MITTIHEALNNHPGMPHQSTLFSSTQQMIPSGTSSNLISQTTPLQINPNEVNAIKSNRNTSTINDNNIRISQDKEFEQAIILLETKNHNRKR